ncbi:helix-turn-helix domain-containing protein [Acinetobacter sp. CFCC 10889]|uniref:helix-turn-helix domain-containing protein n=1 Tax=Acinetobacter sp. CFCC 10889 TaxID=1775557 RepID=UPI000DD02F5E|nr:helix-turn-helix transcriptional regulator [Acinetobacter sp. CFCC 10889]
MNMQNNMTVGDRLSRLLQQQNISQAELADMLDVEQGTVSKICTNKTKKSKYLLEIASILNVSIEWLLYGVGEKDSTESIISNQSGLLQQANKFILIRKYGDINSRVDESPDTTHDKENNLMFDKELLPEGKTVDDIEYIIVQDTGMGKIANVGARVTFDKTNTSVISGKLYTIEIGGLLQPRYLFLLPDQQVRISAEDKENYPDVIVKLDQSNFKILGKVITITNIVN